MDLFRFLAALYTTAFTVHLACNLLFPIGYLPFGLIQQPTKKYKVLRYYTFFGYLIKNYFTVAMACLLLLTWVKAYPGLELAMKVLLVVVLGTWMWSSLVFKERQLRDSYRAMKNLESERPNSEDTANARRMFLVHEGNSTPIGVAHAIGGLLVLIGAIFPRLYENKLVAWVDGWYGRLLEVPILPAVLALFGFLFALRGIFYALLGGGLVIGSAWDRLRGQGS